MHVVLDFRPALRGGTGVGTYVFNLTRALAEGFPESRYTVFSASWKDRLDGTALPRRVSASDHKIPVRALNWAWHRWQRPAIEHFCGDTDVAHSPSPLLLPSRRARSVVSIHDCYFMRHPEDVFGPVLHDYVPLARAAARQADAVIAISETSADDIEEVMGISRDKIAVTPLGVDQQLFQTHPDAAAPVLREFGIERPFLLFVGRREPRKDLGTLLAAFAEIRAAGFDVDLVLVGPDAPRWEQTWNDAPEEARAHTHLLPYQSPGQLAGLYSAANIVAMPSRWEGFGLTGLEAMACGTPVVASRAGALPEILGDAALFADVGDAVGFADQCTRLLQDDELADSLAMQGRDHAARYTWAATAEKTHGMYQRLVS